MYEAKRHSTEQILKLYFLHTTAEGAVRAGTGTIDTVMDTVCENPLYEFFPLGLRLEGRTAVRAFYDCTVRSVTVRRAETGTNLSSLSLYDSPNEVLWVGHDSVVARDNLIYTADDGTEKEFRFLMIFTMTGGLLLGETVFMSAEASEAILSQLDDAFFATPGVSRI